MTVHRLRHLALTALALVLLTGCGTSSSGATKTPSDAKESQGSGSASATNAKAADGCRLVSAAELSEAVGVTYTKIESNGGLCTVTAATQAESFVFHVDKEGGAITWNVQVATIKQDDGSFTSVSGVGDRAVQGAIKEFAAESKGYIVVVDNADVNSPSTYKDFTRSKKVAQALIAKL